MPKFTSHDGIDSNGVRAEVNVMTGTGTIKEILPKGNPKDDGTYRNVEVVFNPDNPHLKRKVYALMDTTASDLYAYAQEALKDQRTVHYRIESQRKRGVDRTKKFEDLVHTEEVVRILAALDNVFSHEAKTNPEEDPSPENPSALPQNNGGRSFVDPAPGDLPHPSWDALTTLIAKNATDGLDQAKSNNFPAEIIDILSAVAVAAGTPFHSVYPTAGLGTRLEVAADAEQFALNHLVEAYSSDASGPIEISDEIVTQAGAIAVRILFLADQVYNTSKDSLPAMYQTPDIRHHALNLVKDAIEKRYPFPLGQTDKQQSQWEQNILKEANTRLVGIAHIAQGGVPQLPEDTPSNMVTETGEDAEPAPVEAFPATEIIEPDDPRFVAPSEALVNRLRALCVNAQVTDDPKAIGNWLEIRTGHRVAKQIHEPALRKLVEEYEHVDPATLRDHIYG